MNKWQSWIICNKQQNEFIAFTDEDKIPFCTRSVKIVQQFEIKEEAIQELEWLRSQDDKKYYSWTVKLYEFSVSPGQTPG